MHSPTVSHSALLPNIQPRTTPPCHVICWHQAPSLGHHRTLCGVSWPSWPPSGPFQASALAHTTFCFYTTVSVPAGALSQHRTYHVPRQQSALERNLLKTAHSQQNLLKEHRRPTTGWLSSCFHLWLICVLTCFPRLPPLGPSNWQHLAQGYRREQSQPKCCPGKCTTQQERLSSCV
jgi:hypothetical protein